MIPKEFLTLATNSSSTSRRWKRTRPVLGTALPQLHFAPRMRAPTGQMENGCADSSPTGRDLNCPNLGEPFAPRTERRPGTLCRQP
jgi:hypothetical protein